MDELPQSNSSAAAVVADDENLAQIRIRTAAAFETKQVPKPILSDWCRSHDFQVPADRIEPPYLDDPDLEIPLVRGAEPALARLGDQLISIIATGPSGIVLSRRTGNRDLHLEGAELLPGFSYGEQFFGAVSSPVRTAAGVPHRHAQAPQSHRGDRMRRDLPRPRRSGRQQSRRSPLAWRLARNDVPQDPRVRHCHPAR
nr:hypothetical protein [Amycolatopsis benzoatilytica]